ncbi:MAG: lysylphosphatidylglycerol synthase domain-containing protein [Halobacteriaceae archaeon]
MNRAARLLAGTALAAGATWPLVAATDLAAVGAELGRARPGYVLVAAALGVAAVALGSEVNRRLAGAAGPVLSPGRFALAYGAAHAVRSLLPFGQAAGPAVTAYAIRSEAGNRYEEGLAAATVAELVQTAASFCVAVLGATALLVAGPTDPVFRDVGVAVLAAGAGLAAVAAVAWRRRDAVGRLVGVAAAVLRGTVGRVSGRTRAATDPGAVQDRLRRYYGVVDDIAADRRVVAETVAVSVAGWLVLGGALAAAGAAMGLRVPLGVALLVPPASALAGAFPSPGGLGAAELALTGLLATLAGLALPVAAAVALLYRVGTYWAPLVAGGACTLWLAVAAERPVPAATEPPVEVG